MAGSKKVSLATMPIKPSALKRTVSMKDGNINAVNGRLKTANLTERFIILSDFKGQL